MNTEKMKEALELIASLTDRQVEHEFTLAAWARQTAKAALEIDEPEASQYNDPIVDPEYRCPNCGENRLDWLTWIEGDTIRCGACGKVYTVAEEEVS